VELPSRQLVASYGSGWRLGAWETPASPYTFRCERRARCRNVCVRLM
jgi:hypothetical protein